MNNITLGNGSIYFEIFIDGLLHLLMPGETIAISSRLDITIYLNSGQTIELVYENIETWKKILELLGDSKKPGL